MRCTTKRFIRRFANQSEGSDKRHANLEQFFELVDLAPVGHEKNDMVVRFNNGVMMRDDYLVATSKGDNIGAAR